MRWTASSSAPSPVTAPWFHGAAVSGRLPRRMTAALRGLRRVLFALSPPLLVEPEPSAAQPAGGVVDDSAEGVLGVAERLGVAARRILRRLTDLRTLVAVAGRILPGEDRGVLPAVDPPAQLTGA